MTRIQKFVAYGSLVFIIFWTLFGVFAIGLILLNG